MRACIRTTLAAAAVAAAAGACSPAEGLPDTDGGRRDITEVMMMYDNVDSDGDTISDGHEGRGEMRDTDRDGTPDYQDMDSDGDGIPDASEAGDADLRSPPIDSDRDGTPDFIDTDSDNNGIPDATEGTDDPDGDGAPNYRDTDDDNDRVLDALELGSNPGTPADTDGDGQPDFRDPDADNDTIGDGDEFGPDTDRDGTNDWHDTDSDGDGWSDAEEAGDADLTTPPADTDSDGAPDFRDADSDSDGLADSEERRHGTSRTNGDTDGDGVSDLVETVYGSRATDPADSPRTRGDFIFVVPYSAPPEPPIPPDPMRDTLSFGTDLQKVDVYIAIDTSGSMGGEISNLRSSFRSTIVPELARRIPDVWFGVGRFEDCPSSTCRNAINNLLDMTGDVARVQSTLDTGLANLCGGREPYHQMLWLLATGDTSGFSGNVQPRPRRCADASAIGWPCFRPDAVRVIVQAGDEPLTGGDLCSPAGMRSAAVAALNAANIKYIGIESTGSSTSSVRGQMEAVARETNSVTDMGAPLVFSIPNTGAGLGTTLVEAVERLSRNVPIRVDALVEDEGGDAVDAVMAFVDHIVTNTAGGMAQGRVCNNVPSADGDGDGRPEHYPRVLPGTSVCWDIVPKSNTTVPATSEAQIFRARIRVVGDRSTPLDSRQIYFLVPPRIRDPGAPG